MQKSCVGSTYVSRYRRSCSWRPDHVQLAFAVRPQFGQNWRTWPARKTFVQWAHRMGVVSGSRTRKGTLTANRGASAAAAPAASAAAPPPAFPVEPPVGGTVVPQAAAGVPSSATVSPSHVCAAEVTTPTGTPPPSETAAGVVGGMWLALVVLPRPNRSLGGG